MRNLTAPGLPCCEEAQCSHVDRGMTKKPTVSSFVTHVNEKTFNLRLPASASNLLKLYEGLQKKNTQLSL